MLRHATIPLARAWNTWSSRPAEMVFLPLGVRLTPMAYAASTGRATLFPPGQAVRYGRHHLDGSLVELGLGACRDRARAGPGPSPTRSRWWRHGPHPCWASGACGSGSTSRCRPRAASRCGTSRRTVSLIVKVGHRFVAVDRRDGTSPGHRARRRSRISPPTTRRMAISIRAGAAPRRRCWRCASISR